jgi:2-C-methyl-D-erythritol 4-phosphate cytidylyltransferase
MSAEPLYAIVPAAGIGRRLPGAQPKQYYPLGERCVIEQTLRILLQQQAIHTIMVVLNPADQYFTTLAIANNPRIQIAEGGTQRVDSVWSGLQRLQSGWVLVHDAVRPCLHPEDLLRLLAARAHAPAGAVLATPVRDSMKRGDAQGKIIGEISRDSLWQALTPQLFPVPLLKACLRQALGAGIEISDEAAALTYCGYAPTLVPGRADNIKITYPEDLVLAAGLLAQR